MRPKGPQPTAFSGSNRPPFSILGLDTAACSYTCADYKAGTCWRLPHTRWSQSPKHVLRFCPLFREAVTRQWSHGAVPQEQPWEQHRGPEDHSLHPDLWTDWGRTMFKHSRRLWCRSFFRGPVSLLLYVLAQKMVMIPVRYFHQDSEMVMTPVRYFHQDSEMVMIPVRYFHQDSEMWPLSDTFIRTVKWLWPLSDTFIRTVKWLWPLSDTFIRTVKWLWPLSDTFIRTVKWLTPVRYFSGQWNGYDPCQILSSGQWNGYDPWSGLKMTPVRYFHQDNG